jgi:hypothetical protein
VQCKYLFPLEIPGKQKSNIREIPRGPALLSSRSWWPQLQASG